jgi:hypothetical protein
VTDTSWTLYIFKKFKRKPNNDTKNSRRSPRRSYYIISSTYSALFSTQCLLLFLLSSRLRRGRIHAHICILQHARTAAALHAVLNRRRPLCLDGRGQRGRVRRGSVGQPIAHVDIHELAPRRDCHRTRPDQSLYCCGLVCGYTLVDVQLYLDSFVIDLHIIVMRRSRRLKHIWHDFVIRVQVADEIGKIVV